MSRCTFVVALVALALASSHVTAVSAIAMLCSNSAAPVAPRAVRIESQRWQADRGRVEVIIAFDNPTTETTGCITSTTVSLVDSRNSPLGSRVSLSNPITSPIRHTYSLTPGSRFTLQFAETQTAAGRSARTAVNLQFMTMKAPAPPATSCNPNAAPVAPLNVRIASQVFDSTKGRTTVTFAWDNPTTSSTGCITWFTVSLSDSKGQALGAKSGLSSPLTNPISSRSSLMPGQRYTLNFVENETSSGKKARTSVNLTFTANGPVPIQPFAASG